MNGFLRSTIVFTLAAAISFAGVDDWAHWRGPDRKGVARGDAPLAWSDTENVKWKVALPGHGNSSPIIWGDRIFLTTAIQIGETPPEPSTEGGRRPFGGARGTQPEHKFVVMALDKATGKVIWERTATTASPHEGYHRTYGSYASATPVTDGEHLFAYFGSRGLYCYDLDGELIWQKDLGKFEIKLAFGEGAAPTVHGETLIVNVDHEGDSFIVALNKNDGAELWRRERDEQSNWSEPVVFEQGGVEQIVVSADNRVRSYDLRTGSVIWECGGLGGNVIPVPVHEDGLIVVMSGWRDANMMAIRLGGQGDLTDTDAVVWSQTRGVAYTPSPVLLDGKLYVLSDRGMISCFNLKTGEPYYHQQRLPGTYNFKASLVAANGKLYLASENEDVLVLKMGGEYEVLATNKLTDEMFVATPAIAGGEIFLRSQKNLYCISDGR